MKFTKIFVPFLALIVIAGSSADVHSQTQDEKKQNVKSAAKSTGQRELTVPAGQTAISGCLQGKPDSYRLTEKDGTMHLLMGSIDLSNSVGHIVQLVGYADDDCDASASSDEGTPDGLRFFLVEAVASDSGQCKR